MRLLIDTNVVLDVLLKRQPFYEMSSAVLKLCGREDIQEYVSASAITDIYYIANRMIKDKDTVRELLKNLLRLVSVALLNSMDGLITRNSGDYARAKMPVWTPEEIIKLL